MKKFRNLVIGGIESKIVSLILVAMILVAGAFLAVTLTQNGMLTKLAADTSEKQLGAISDTTGAVMDTVIRQNMDRIMEYEAQTTDEMFRDAGIRVRMVADYAQKLLSDPKVQPAGWTRPVASSNGELFVKALFADGVDEDDVADRLGVIANLSDMMCSVCETYGSDNIWISMPEGVTLMADTVPGNWIASDGSYVSYNATSRYWYKQAAEAGELIFTDVEYDKRTGAMCVTCALPVYGEDGTLQAVVGTDLFLTEMQRAVSESTEENGYLMVVNRNGHMIIAPEENNVFRVTDSAQAADLRESDNAELAALVKDALVGKTDVRVVKLENGNYYMIGVPMETVGWALIASFSEEVAGQPVRTLQQNYREIQGDASAVYAEKSYRGRETIIIAMLIALVLMMGGALLAGKRIVRPLNRITKRISDLKDGNLEFKMEDVYRTGDEVEALAQSFANLSHKNAEYVEQVKTVTAEKERISTELDLARKIQEGMLPSIFPPYPERKEFDLYAAMDPAKEVGGDFYDFFLIDDDHLALVMADVSGKGVPGALFMMVSKAILKNNAMMNANRSAAEILSATNETICANNTMEMFVTVWLGILQISTGRIVAANAGHEYPAIYRKGGRFELYKDKHGFVIGGMEGVRYRDYELNMQPGDRLFLYTDGVPEATSGSQELFGTDRMISALNECDGTPEDILKGVRRSVDGFVGDAEQFDDLTMLCLEYRGNEKTLSE